jgi:hypothetical protein
MDLIKSLIVMMLVLATVHPAFAQQAPTSQEQSLYQNMRSNFEKLDIPKKDISDVLKSFSGPVTISFPCNTGDYNRHVTATVKTNLARFDNTLSHSGGITTGGVYVWKCTITSYDGHLTIQCENELMLNYDAITSVQEKDQRIRQVEELVVFYHEMLHGQLMIDAMKSSGEWRANTCNRQPQQKLDYSYTDTDHKVIMPLQTEFAQNLIAKSGGIMNVVHVMPEEAPSGAFSKDAGSLREYPQYSRGGINISARSYNINGLDITTQSDRLVMSGNLVDMTQSGTIWLYVFGAQNPQPVQPSAQQPSQTQATTQIIRTEPESKTIPPWIKNTARWWASGIIPDKDFVLGIQYLIQNKIITVGPTVQGQTEDRVPSWVKNTARWWADDLISDAEFVASLQYLIRSGIISTAQSANQQQFLQLSKDVVERGAYSTSQIHVTGKVENYRSGTYVTLEMQRPDGISVELQGVVTSKGLFTVPIIIDAKSPQGLYTVRAVYQNSEVGTASFTVR